MNDFFEDYLINSAIATLLMTIKNPGKAAKLHDALIKVRNAINSAFPGE